MEDTVSKADKADIDSILAGFSYKNTPPFSLAGKRLRARVIDVYDGDTMTVAMLFAGEVSKFSVRVHGIDTCEMKSKNVVTKGVSTKARNRVVEVVSRGVIKAGPETARKDLQVAFAMTVCMVDLECFEFDKYGRVLANVWVDGVSVGDLMLGEGLAFEYFGGTKLTEAQQADALLSRNNATS